ncbi:hypothetical protein BDV25DRAFT_166641 [Aspergillus avenaceus]|uniref:Uncharacterized protein n=1 Tax=Aspergillus avenaceus TaxID=36643 RepID=A0A5N6TEI6_ASPAV|nr:hypothetical protein BDV25DRAFT_166641 [Aspergillus avenaceus]
MSGLNPFRPRKPENPTIHHRSSSTSIASNSASFVSPSSATTPSVGSKPNGLPGAPSTSHKLDLDNSTSSDDQSVSDPFHQDTYISEDDMYHGEIVEPTERNPSGPLLASRAGDRHQTAIGSAAPHPAPYLSQPALAIPTTLSLKQTGSGSQDHTLDQQSSETDYDPTAVGSDVVLQSLPSQRGPCFDNTKTTDAPHITIRTVTLQRPGIGKASSNNAEAKPLASRPGNREKIPPPPPKSHHGKLINPSPNTIPSSSPRSATSTNRFSFHGSPQEPLTSPVSSHATEDYFTGSMENETGKPNESLRRSQSQYKRPPTPPISRRHSQMKRSKSTMSKPNPSRSSLPAGKTENSESPPPSPSSWTLDPLRTRDAKLGGPSGENPRRPSLQQTSSAATTSPGTEVSTPSSQPNSRTPSTKRASVGNPLPPPPPPRRTRNSSSQSNDSIQPAGIQSEKRRGQDEEFVPHPSNARDILADLSRLQKEVDDLRVHYESRKASH